MKTRITPIIAGVATAVCLAQAAGATSEYGGPQVVTWRGPNNIQDCAKDVQKRIQTLDKRGWKRVSFQCRDGLVIKLNAPGRSPADDSIRFLREYYSLFGHGKIEVDNDGNQRFHGLPIMSSANGWDLTRQGLERRTAGNAYMLEGQFADTRAWKYQTPKIISEAAGKAAAEFWKSRMFPAETVKVEGPYYLDVSRWQTLNGEQSDASYFLAWWITGKDKYGSNWFAAINAANGRAISFPLRPVQ